MMLSVTYMQFFILFALIFMSICMLACTAMITYTLFRIFGIPIAFIPGKQTRDNLPGIEDKFNTKNIPIEAFSPNPKNPPKLVIEHDKFDPIKKGDAK